ncbi:sugar ABC transporter substrate-binding protein [Streptomyces himalayensis]|uniref:Substrate-binding domain-containing protein n=1 Tax=Streptomyces himalayensis subsp. himalayensis TaxID=2756131 RepID=A0A7W0DI09_9ACTN|nr:substrate-binding domain-containing protein [Streptomyces himalayensis]MBA2945462.1 substrate-binding domain-containing protein [Streptomyces himalayensis subsp. himalayensis]
MSQGGPRVRAHPGRAVVTAATVTLAVGLAACGTVGEPSDSGGITATNGGSMIGLLLPSSQSSRYETWDRPLIEQRIQELCDDCTVEYANAQLDVAAQQQQVDVMITKGVEVLILDPVDARSLRSSVEKADRAGIPVVAYDRLAEGPISGYVSYDNERVGVLQGEALLEALGDKADGAQIVMLNGSPTDPNAATFKRGALSVLQGKVKIGKAYDAPGWRSEEAHASMSSAVAALGADNIDGVYAASDNLATGAISALKAAKIEPLPPVTGQNAELAAVQRIVSGEQYMSVYKPYQPEADAAAAMAVALRRGEELDEIAERRVDSPTTKNVPAVVLDPVPVTVDNIKETVVKDGVYTIDQICTPKFRSACEKTGLIG